ncbi:MAG: complex I subunit 5 family protein [Bryobacteraceae bacterium]
MITSSVLAVGFPFAGAVLAFLAGRRTAAGAGLVAALLTGAASAAVAWSVWTGGPQRYPLSGWGAPLGIDFYLDGLSAVMLLVTAVTGLLISVYALGYFPLGRDAGRWSESDGFWPLWLMLWGSLNALFLSADIFNYYVILEVMTLAAAALIILSRDLQALTAAVRYLLVAFLGSLSYLLGVALVYADYGILDIYQLSARVEPGPAVWIALALMTVGLLLKTALFPLHFWLPPAHASAPAPGSAVLSALVVKASFYVLLRMWFGVFAHAVTFPAAQFVGLLGAIAIVWGSLQALRQQRLKLLIAHSTVAQIGYLFLLVPLVLSPVAGRPAGATGTIAAAAWKGGIYHLVSHACAKAAMFLAAGVIIHAFGHDRLRNMHGVADNLRFTTFAFGLAGVSLMGLPPTGGFVGKYLLVNAAIASGQWWWAVVVLVGGLLAAGYVFLFIGRAWLPRGKGGKARFQPVPLTMELPAMILAFIAVVLGFIAVPPLELLSVGTPFPSGEGAR